MESKHTATPWKYYKFSSGNSSYGYIIRSAGNPGTSIFSINSDVNSYRTDEICEANIKFIIRACNAHDQLVTEGLAIVDIVQNFFVQPEDGTVTAEAIGLALARLQSALAKAGAA